MLPLLPTDRRDRGALRDMVPNHVFQLLAMTTMEPPISFEADAVRHVTAFDQGTLSDS
jgi:glucose-6-phosphate 1-dehydrogenase